MMRRSFLVGLLSGLPLAAMVLVPSLAACSDGSDAGDGGDDGASPPTTTVGSGDGVAIDDAVFAGKVADGLGDGAPAIDFDALVGLPAVVNFWASTCIPCQQEMPDLQSVHEAAGDAVTFVGIAVNDNVEKALAFAEEKGVTYLLGTDPGGDLFVDAGATFLPTTFVLDPGGNVVHQFTGQVHADELAATITETTGTEVALG